MVGEEETESLIQPTARRAIVFDTLMIWTLCFLISNARFSPTTTADRTGIRAWTIDPRHDWTISHGPTVRNKIVPSTQNDDKDMSLKKECDFAAVDRSVLPGSKGSFSELVAEDGAGGSSLRQTAPMKLTIVSSIARNLSHRPGSSSVSVDAVKGAVKRVASDESKRGLSPNRAHGTPIASPARFGETLLVLAMIALK